MPAKPTIEKLFFLRPNKSFVILIVLLQMFSSLNAQSPLAFTPLAIGNTNKETSGRNFSFIDLGITGNEPGNYSAGYERSIAKNTSVAISFKGFRGYSLPIKNLSISTAGQNDPNMIRTIENLRIRHSAITSELRLYTGKKGYGKGFYIAPFYRYACFKTNDISVRFGEKGSNENTISLSGKLVTATTGLKFGARWSIGKRINLNWWLLGPHFGTGIGVFSGVANKALTSQQQDNIRAALHNLDIPLSRKSVSVDDKGGSIALNGLWAGLRGGVAIGLKY